MRARNIQPGFFTNEELAECRFESRLLFVGLWCLADREGRLEDRPKRIKMEIFPADKVDCDSLLAELENHRLIVRYAVSGQGYISIPTFLKHQSPHHNERQSIIPGPPEQETLPAMVESASNQSTKHEPPRDQAIPPDSLIPDSLIPESKNSSSHPSGCDKGGGGPVEAEKTGKDPSLSEPGDDPKSLSPAKQPHACDGEALRLARLLRDIINERSPGLVPATTNMKAWAKSMRLMIERDKRTPADIEAVIRWCQTDSFWCSNILSAVKLREKFGQLWDRMHARAGPSGRQRTWMDELNEEETHAATGV